MTTSRTALLESVLRALQLGVGTLVGSEPSSMTSDLRFVDTGLNSIKATSLVAALTAEFGVELSPTAVWKYPTIAEFAAHVVDLTDPVRRETSISPGPAAVRASEPIAVVGVGCRFPGGSDPAHFWSSLAAGRDAVMPMPPARRRLAPAAALRSVGGVQVPTEAGYLDWALDEFDPMFFGISPREAAEMDPQQRLLLEVAWEALESAGLSDEHLTGSRTGVFVGAIWHDFADVLHARGGPPSAHTATGQATNMIANRLSYVLGLRGPSLTLDSACSSSLLAVHLACQSLRLGESDIAVAGGVNLILGEHTTAALTGFGGLAPDGRCKSFDSRADGFGRGEGCGAVVLKPLSVALADGDRIWATIEGSAANNDGPSNGLTAPSPVAQEEVLAQACALAGVDGSQLHYVECHGTGTALGDPIEAEALGAALGRGRAEDSPLLIGSVKSNIGHLEAAAGIAGFIKTVLALRHGKIPPTLHLIEPNPRIAFRQLGLQVPTSLVEWPAADSRLAGVSAFGWGGTNVHVVLRGWDEPNLPASPDPTATDGAAFAKPSTIAFVCSPHGHAWFGMGRQMHRREPVFRAALDRVSEEYSRHAPVRLAELLFCDEERLALDDVTIMQPLQFAVQFAVAEWLRSQGIVPAMVLGHSLGEISAAVIAGMLDLPDAVRLLFHYCAQQGRVASPEAGMAIIELPAAELADYAEVAAGTVTIAAENSPSSTALAGPVRTLRAVVRQAKSVGAAAALIRVNVSAHSSAIDPIMDDLRAAISAITLHAGQIPMISTVTGEPLQGMGLTGEYFATNLRQPVRLGAATRYALEHGCDALLEISANPVLTDALAQSVRDSDSGAIVLASMRRPDELASLRQLTASLGMLGGDAPAAGHSVELFTIAARSAHSLREQACAIGAALQRADDSVSLADVVQTASRRANGDHRLALLAYDLADLQEQLAAVGADQPSSRRWTARSLLRRPGGVAFVFPGQGSQWLGMGRELYAEEPVFAAMIERCDQAAREFVEYSITEVLLGSQSAARLEDIDVLQPLLFAIEVALAETWRSWGVTPAAVIGHSMGEAAAAYICGAMSLPHAIKVLCERSRLMKRMSGLGAMLSVELGVDELAADAARYAGQVSVAVSNSPRSTVLSGDPLALADIKAGLDERGEFCRWVKVDVASHSPQMDSLLPELRILIADVSGRPAELAMFSTVTDQIEDGSRLSAEYWCDNLRKPVLFASQIQRLLDRGTTAFIEMSPHPVLLASIESIAATNDLPVVAVASLRRDEAERASMLASLGELYVEGIGFDRGRPTKAARRDVELPGYPWDRQRHWPASLQGAVARLAGGGLTLSDRLDPVGEPGAHYWQVQLSTEVCSIGDHRFGSSVVIPGAVYLELMISAACGLFGAEKLRLSDVTFHKPLGLPEDGSAMTLQVLAMDAGDAALIRVHALTELGPQCVAEAGARALTEATRPPAVDVSATSAQLPRHRDSDTFYQQLAARGLRLGPAYRGVESIRSGPGQALSKIVIPPGRMGDEGCRVNPALLDAALQTAIAVQPDPAEAGPATALVSASIDEVLLFGVLPVAALVHTVLKSSASSALGEVDLAVCADDGTVVLGVHGIRLAELDLALIDAPAGNGAQASAGHPERGAARTTLAGLTAPAARLAAARSMVVGVVSAAVRLEADRIDPDQPLRDLGLDSATSLEVRNRLEAMFGLRLHASLTFNYPTVRAIADFLLESLDFPAEPVASASAAPPPAPPSEDVRLPLVIAADDIDRELDELTRWIGQA
jgi:acyl transferase domain-containing protein